jgi:23S rRNA (cytosine1962-C5)-methyltransferase
MSNPHLELRVQLKKKEELRIIAGHPWVFSNEIATVVGTPAAGDVVEVLTAGGKTVGVGFYHPHSLIAVRLLSTAIEEIDRSFFQRRFEQARALREVAYPGSGVFRLVNGESDFLPGLVVDKFDTTLVVQTFSYGMDSRLPVICEALDQIFHPSCIAERNESPLRALESLPERKGILSGSPAELVIEDWGIRYYFHPLEGQKTGYFLDQRENRLLCRRYSHGARVLDCFCNDGGFALNAARGNATSVLAMDAASEEIRRAERNAELNGLDSVRFEANDIFGGLQSLLAKGRQFDLIVLDPPSFTRNRKSVPAAKRGYRELHEGSFRLLRSGGILLTASCSHHIEPDTFLGVIQDAAQRTNRRLQLLDWRGASPDHPVLPGVSETRYLKFGVFRVV